MSTRIESSIGERTTVWVEFDFDPGQREIRYPNDRAQPGFPPSVEITAVTLEDSDQADNLIDSFSDDEMDRFETEVWDWLKTLGDY